MEISWPFRVQSGPRVNQRYVKLVAGFSCGLRRPNIALNFLPVPSAEAPNKWVRGFDPGRGR